MRIWQVWYQTSDLICQEWFPNKREANAFVSRLKRDDIITGPSHYILDLWEIPTDKKGLISWLNHHCNNGESSL